MARVPVSVPFDNARDEQSALRGLVHTRILWFLETYNHCNYSEIEGMHLYATESGEEFTCSTLAALDVSFATCRSRTSTAPIDHLVPTYGCRGYGSCF